MGQTFGARHALTKQAKLLTRKLFLFLYRHPFPWTHSDLPATPAFVFRHFIYAISGRSLLRSLAIHNLTVKRRGSKLPGGPHSFLLFSRFSAALRKREVLKEDCQGGPVEDKNRVFRYEVERGESLNLPHNRKTLRIRPGGCGRVTHWTCPALWAMKQKKCMCVCIYV